MEAEPARARENAGHPPEVGAALRPADPETVTYLQMTSRDQLRPGRPAAGVTLERLARGSALIRPTVTRIGAPYGWPSAGWSDDRWTAWLAEPTLRQWLVRRAGEVAGLCELKIHPADEVEIATFGLVPESVGAGLGGHALTLAVRVAWDGERPDAGPVRRVWLHTSTADHPNALHNYLNRGFQPYRTGVRRPT